MASDIGPVVRRLRERWRLTQQDVVEYARLERSSSYISSIETGKTSPTLAELEAMAIVFRTNALEMIRRAQGGAAEPPPEDTASGRIQELYQALGTEEQALAEDLLQVLVDRKTRRKQ